MKNTVPGLLLSFLLLLQVACSAGPVILSFDKIPANRQAQVKVALDETGIEYDVNPYGVPDAINSPTLIYPITYPAPGQINAVVEAVEALGYSLKLRQSPYKNHAYSSDRFGLYLME